jgi:hypothetical protein
VSNPVLLFPASRVDKPAARRQLAKRQAEVDPGAGGRLDLGNDVTPVDRHDGLPGTQLDVGSEGLRQFLQGIV